ncbi:MAG: ATP-binding cassette domain-containing protein [Methanobrevibacter sp.]|jgi:ABC-2 type transport system ATP-binding protein|nr:ATP-binding cassette domain-containing protein [Candidatus Methanovirga aequatorialis]
MKYAIETNDLSRKYGDFLAVDSLDMKIKNKSIFGFLGPNGAGKTSTIKMLTCLIKPTSGTAKVSGYDVIKYPNKVRNKIGMVPQLVSLYKDLTARENVSLCADYYGIDKNIKESRIDELMELVDIKYAENKLVKHMSGGQKQKVSVVASLVHSPDILFLDEPTIGLDPTTKMVLWDLIQDLNDDGHTIILCSHDMYEVDKLCENIGVMNKGHLVAFNTPQVLKDNLMKEKEGDSKKDVLNVGDSEPKLTVELSVMVENWLSDEIIEEIRNLSFVYDLRSSYDERGRLTVDVDKFSHREGISDVIAIILKGGGLISSISTTDPSLEDVFVDLTSKGVDQYGF